MRTLLAFSALLLIGCGDDSTTEQDLAVADLAGADHAVSAGDLASGDAGNMATLKLENYLSWCTVTVNGGAGSTTGTQTLTFATGAVVNLGGDKANSTFVWGYWRGTAGDTTAAHDTAMTTTVTMSGNKTVQACCPFASSPSTPCPDPT